MLVEFFLHNLLWTEGISLLMVLALAAIVCWKWYKPLLIGLGCFFIFFLFFFRNPVRISQTQSVDALVSPADGKIVLIERNIDIPFQDTNYNKWCKIAIFLSPFDVHVTRSPVRATVEKVEYKSGTFTWAWSERAGIDNERNSIYLRDTFNRPIIVTQIAGILARRIVCWVQPQDRVTAGQSIGMIKFGSRVEICIPEPVTLAVASGEYVYGGQTVLGNLSYSV
jgi:phosphatidylserine decarboxylase